MNPYFIDTCCFIQFYNKILPSDFVSLAHSYTIIYIHSFSMDEMKMMVSNMKGKIAYYITKQVFPRKVRRSIIGGLYILKFIYYLVSYS